MRDPHIESMIAELGRQFSGAPLSPDTQGLFFKARQEVIYCWLADEKSAACPAGFRRAFQTAEARQREQKGGIKQLFEQLEREDIPFVPIKGVDLAFRVYPSPELRIFGDWDIWVRKADLKHFIAVLERDGWRCPLDSYGDHHCGMRLKGAFHLEPHFNLPNFSGVRAEELWELTEAVPGKKAERRLSDNLNLIMLLRHGIGCHGQWSDPLKLLLDFEFLLRRGGVDWQRVSELVKRWHVAHPGLLIAAFPEFFRGRYDPGKRFSGEQISALRELLLDPQDWSAELGVMKARTANPLRRGWIRTQLARFRRDNMRLKHPEIGRSNVRYLAYLVRDVLRKIGFFCAGYLHPGKSVNEQLKKESLIDSSWR